MSDECDRLLRPPSAPSRNAGAHSSLITHHSSLKIGLLAGAGRFPVAFAEKAKMLGLPVVTVGVRRQASPELIGLSSEFHWTGLGRMGGVIRRFKRAGVREIVMAGKVQKSA